MKQNKKQKIIILTCTALIIGVITIATVSIVLILNKSDTTPNQNNNNDNSAETTNDSDNENNEDKEKVDNDEDAYISDPNYPYDLPSDSPITFDNIEKYTTKANKRYSIWYFNDKTSEDEFAKRIEPYVDLFIASSEYVFEEYSDTFTVSSSEVNARESLTIRVYEKCSDVSAGIGEEACKDVKLVASASPFTYNVSFFANLDHPDFKPEFLIITGMHETIHLLQYTYDGGTPGSLIPVWYKESMAEALAYDPDHQKEIYPELFENFTYPQTLEDLNLYYKGGDGSPEDVDNMRRAYYIGQQFYFYLLEKCELEEYLQLIPKRVSYSGNNEFEEKFTKIFGKESEEMYQNFLKSAQ